MKQFHDSLPAVLTGILAALGLSVLSSAPSSAETTLASQRDAIAKALGRTGKIMPGEVYRIGLPRTDLHVTLHGISLAPTFALGGYAVYKAEPNGTLVLGDLPLLESEVGPVEQSLTNSG